MIKYFEYDAFDETGQHIIPVNNLYQMNKTASGTYSPELMKVILNMKRRPDRYYVVINALGSHEAWGSNRNGDGFPKSGLEHISLRTDMGTPNDYGYKTFEYYAKLYKHHVNKNNPPVFGEVIFSHWNPVIQRVELIVGVNTESGADIVKALNNGDNVAVSMGCKVKYDRCSICGNKAKTRDDYCKHLKNYMNKIVSKETAAIWSKELGITILPGIQVFAYNDFPRFFDISKVYIGADKTAYVLGKAASSGVTVASVDMAEAYGVTDEDIDKLSAVGKESEMDKNIGGALTPTSTDGVAVKADASDVIRKAIDEKMNKTISSEPQLPRKLLDSMSVLPLNNIFSTMLGMGMYPKPAEVQRIIIVKVGRKDVADELEDKGQIFDYNDNSHQCDCNISNSNFSDTLSKILLPHMESRSCFPTLLKARLEKEGAYSSTEGKDYWLESGPNTGSFIEQSTISPLAKALGGLAAIYAGLKIKALGYGPKQIAGAFLDKPWLRAIIGGGAMWKIQDAIDKSHANDPILRPASDYAGVLQNTNFSGHVKTSAFADAIILPNAYLHNATTQASFKKKAGMLFPGAGGIEKSAAFNGTFLTKELISEINDNILKVLPNNA